MGYDHPPRALMDAKDAGVPIRTENDRASDGKRMARYFLDEDNAGTANNVGRAPIPKAIKTALLERDGPYDQITGAQRAAGKLTVDHRIPYQVGGDAGLEERNLSAFMLLDLSSQRRKSWACEHCENFTSVRDLDVCRSCFWASPADYEHVALEKLRRTDVLWMGSDVAVHDELKMKAVEAGTSVADILKQLARRSRK